MEKSLKASAQYNDLYGTIAIDFHNSISEFNEFCKKNKIDMETYDPVGISFYCGSQSKKMDPFIAISVIAIEKELYQKKGYKNYLQ